MSSNDDERSMKAVIHSKERLFDGVFKIDQLTVSHEQFGGGMSEPFPWLVFERGDSVAVILYKRDTQEIVLVRQFRAPTLKYRQTEEGFRALNEGWLDETVAGMPEANERPEDCAIREVREETGYIVPLQNLELISRFYASPGGTSERIVLYYAEVTDADRSTQHDQKFAGIREDNENILVRHIPVSEFYASMLDPETPIDAKVLIASMHLRNRLLTIPDAAQQTAATERVTFTVHDEPALQIVLRCGNILAVNDVDAWVNPENTYMEMDRFIGRSISSTIRFAGAAKDGQDRVIEDTIAEALAKKMRRAHHCHIGTVHDTTPGTLYDTHNVTRIFHIAAVAGTINNGAIANAAQIEMITTKALEAIEKRNAQYMTTACTSVLLPMIGSGDGGLSVEIALPEIVKGILGFFTTRTRRRRMTAVHINAFTANAATYAMQYLGDHPALQRQT